MAVPQKIKNRTTIRPSNSHPKGNEVRISKESLHSVFTAALLTKAKTWKQPKCPRTHEWIKKIQCTYPMEHNSALKKQVLLPLVITWMDLDDIMLSEVSQTEKRNAV